MTTAPTFAERILLVHQALDRAKVGHGFGGAVALAYYVEEPRATRHIDVNIFVGTEHAHSVLTRLPEGIEVPPDGPEVVDRDGQIRLWWDGPCGIPVDLFFRQHDFHRHVARDIRTVRFLDTVIPIISATHLTVFKCLFNRPRDWPDVAAMLEAGTVDVDDALGWLDLLLGRDSAQYLRLAGMAKRTLSVPPQEPGPQRDLPVVDWRSLGEG